MVLVRTGCLFALAAVVALAGACSKRPGATGTDARFRGQILRIVVGRSPGGTYDLYARAMAEYFGRHVPGHPTVVVENMPGAGGLLALKYLAREARPDGLTIGQVGLPGTLAQVTDDPETQADAGTVSRARLAGRRRAGLRVFARKPDRSGRLADEPRPSAARRHQLRHVLSDQHRLDIGGTPAAGSDNRRLQGHGGDPARDCQWRARWHVRRDRCLPGLFRAEGRLPRRAATWRRRDVGPCRCAVALRARH